MLDCKEMKTMMVTNLKILSDESSERVDVTLYRHIIDSQVYLKNTRSYIGFVVNTLSQYMVETRHVHLVAVRHVMRYLKGTLYCGLTYVAYHEFRLCGYTNLDWEGSVEDRKRTLGCSFILG